VDQGAGEGVIEFDELKHEYTLGGRKLPGVTTILKPFYGDLRFVKQDILDYKSELGVAVHKAVELHVLGGLDYGSLVSPVAEYFDQYLAFEAETGFVATQSEARVHSALGYAGTFDLGGYLRKKSSLVDLKTTAALSPVVALQTAAYQQAANEMKICDTLTHRYALRLTPEKYRLVPFTGASDFAVFLSLLKIHQWSESTGKTYEVQP
jgi:hypothetical protein